MTRPAPPPGVARPRAADTHATEFFMTIVKLCAPLACLLERRIERRQLRRGDAYLAQATDHADLELRQRQLARPPATIPSYG